MPSSYLSSHCKAVPSGEWLKEKLLFRFWTKWRKGRKFPILWCPPEKVAAGMPRWLSQLSIWLLILAQVVTSGSWDWAPDGAPSSVESCFRILSLTLPLLLLSVRKINKSLKRKKKGGCYLFSNLLFHCTSSKLCDVSPSLPKTPLVCVMHLLFPFFLEPYQGPHNSTCWSLIEHDITERGLLGRFLSFQHLCHMCSPILVPFFMGRSVWTHGVTDPLSESHLEAGNINV